MHAHRTINIAFVSFAEPYQIYHGAAVMFELMRTPGVHVRFFYNDPETPAHLERIRRAHDAPPVEVVRLLRPPLAATGLFGLAKRRVLQANASLLSRFDAVVSLEDGIHALFEDLPPARRPARIFIEHGAGDRHMPSSVHRDKLDLILVKGRKDVENLLGAGLARPGHIAATGYTKHDTTRRLARPVHFPEARKVVLYNPHRDARLGSWRKFIGPMLEAFEAQTEFNLIVAPHVKLMRRWPAWRQRLWLKRSRPHIVIDPGSHRSCDNSYTESADIYVGDVSSQVYEFVARPRPCVFLNASGALWRGDPHFLFWQMGDVVHDPARLMDAIRAAPERHARYEPRQRSLVEQSLGDCGPEASRNAALKILNYLAEGRVPLPTDHASVVVPFQRSGASVRAPGPLAQSRGL